MVSTVIFTWVHQLTISNIWFMIIPMLIAGALSGLCIAWSYTALFENGSTGRWFAYNGAFLAMFALLAVSSIVLLDPVTTMAEVTAASGPVHHLIVPALPATGAVAGLTTLGLGTVLARRWTDYLRLLGTVVVLMVLVGLNISVLGLIDFGGASLVPVLNFFALVVLLDAVYAVAYLVFDSSPDPLRSPPRR
jgi:hypothetical protein